VKVTIFVSKELTNIMLDRYISQQKERKSIYSLQNLKLIFI